MDAGPSHTSQQSLSSEYASYSDTDSNCTSSDYEGDRDVNDEVSSEARPAASDYSDEYEGQSPGSKGKGKGKANPNVRHQKGDATLKVKVQREDRARSWSDLNVSMIIALLSPVGNWLTGSDHVKNLFLLLLLVFYLHQLTEGARIDVFVALSCSRVCSTLATLQELARAHRAPYSLQVG